MILLPPFSPNHQTSKPMKHPTNIQPSSFKITEGGHPTSIVLALLLMAASALALPQPIRNGVLTGTLNANRQAVTNVGTLTFTDGTTLNTAAVRFTIYLTCDRFRCGRQA